MKQITQTQKYFAQKYLARIFFEYKSHHFPLSTKTIESVINEKQKMQTKSHPRNTFIISSIRKAFAKKPETTHLDAIPQKIKAITAVELRRMNQKAIFKLFIFLSFINSAFIIFNILKKLENKLMNDF